LIVFWLFNETIAIHLNLLLICCLLLHCVGYLQKRI
jgi:hypothetical protein